MFNLTVCQKGFGLIEVLVAAFVIAVGVLGISSAQMISLKNNQSAYFRSQSNFLIIDMIDRMRANPASILAYNNFDTNPGAVPNPPACADASGCTPDEIAARDLQEWAALFPNSGPNNPVGLIPGSIGQIRIDPTVGPNSFDVTITISWEEDWDQFGAATTHAAQPNNPIPIQDGRAGVTLTVRL